VAPAAVELIAGGAAAVEGDVADVGAVTVAVGGATPSRSGRTLTRALRRADSRTVTAEGPILQPALVDLLSSLVDFEMQPGAGPD